VKLKIAYLRSQKAWSQKELADLCDTTQQQIAKIEKGTVDPRLSSLRKIASAFAIEVKDLFWSRAEFLKLVECAVLENGLDVESLDYIALNLYLAETKKLSEFHPYWNSLRMESNKFFLKEDL
jgi:DNA-binding XRE family transcriptional regulator